jgi:hypothetical protein
MHEITGKRDEVLKLLHDTVQQLGQNPTAVKKAGVKAMSLKSESQWSGQRDQLVDFLKTGYDIEQPKKKLKAAGLGAVPNERAVESWYAPRNQAVAVFQAAMDEYLTERFGAHDPGEDGAASSKKATKKKGVKAQSLGAKVSGAKVGDTVPARPTIDAFYQVTAGVKKAGVKAAAIVTQFSNLDPGWVEVVAEKAKVLFKGKHKFIKHTSPNSFQFDLKDENQDGVTTIAVVGDWGGGNEAAQAVAAQIRALKPDHVIHLGDVYYAGTTKEVQERFLKYWPAPAGSGRSFALNSNHEMYSGGYGYFDVTLPEFKQPASYFCLADENWRFIGLDTGYIDHDLNSEQVDWLTAQFKKPFKGKTVLLSHHQLFSAYEDTNAAHLQARVQPFLDAKQIHGWIWGHEHLNVAYEPFMNVQHAVCLGNGCFPYDPPSSQPKVPVKWMNNRLQSSAGSYRGVHSYAVLRVSAKQVKIEYRDQDGFLGFQDIW